ncbi:PREDICTED: limbic system-associated membrane protein-like isoform X1 [Cyprinodon variegatus]|uniref:B-cell receptor CD22 n=1 Tax=Cyprinodon variegatus TaxID=28743 RepID=A0A3Q2DGC6_CYPVA|nr:PREDICTED: limbic system-associated membrane protein-like isoform X1 [Cyprinodon variegatus]
MDINGGLIAHQQSYCCLLIIVCMRGVLAGDWSVHLPSSPICAVVGSSVVLSCSYDYPLSSDQFKADGPLSAQTGGNEKGLEYKVLSEMWCLGDSRCITERYVFHSAGIFPDPSYENRVEYLGQPGTKNCSLRISDLKESDSGTYVFYLITNHTTEKMPPQTGIQLLVAADSFGAVAVSAGPSHIVSEGAALSLACCSPAATAQSQFTWYKSTESRVLHAGQVWIIRDVTPEKSGNYHCQMKTGNDMQKSNFLAINVHYPPRNTSISILGAQDDYPVTLTCSSEANPPVDTYVWYQGEACRPTADKSFHPGRRTKATLTGRGPTFSMANFTTETYGQHCCVARNRHGSDSMTFSITDSRAKTPSDSLRGKTVLIGVTVGILAIVVATVAFLMMRGKKKARHRSYVLTGTTVTES